MGEDTIEDLTELLRMWRKADIMVGEGRSMTDMDDGMFAARVRLILMIVRDGGLDVTG